MTNGGEGLTFSEAHGDSGWENLADLFSDNNEAIGNDENSNNDTNSDESSYDFDGWKPDKDADNVKIGEDNRETTETESDGSKEEDGLEGFAKKLDGIMGKKGEQSSDNERQVAIGGLLQHPVVCGAVSNIIGSYFRNNGN